MAIQSIDGKPVYVVDLNEMPQLPVTGMGIEFFYADALTQALLRKVIVPPGKFGIAIDFSVIPHHWDAFRIEEP